MATKTTEEKRADLKAISCYAPLIAFLETHNITWTPNGNALKLSYVMVRFCVDNSCDIDGMSIAAIERALVTFTEISEKAFSKVTFGNWLKQNPSEKRDISKLKSVLRFTRLSRASTAKISDIDDILTLI